MIDQTCRTYINVAVYNRVLAEQLEPLRPYLNVLFMPQVRVSFRLVFTTIHALAFFPLTGCH